MGAALLIVALPPAVTEMGLKLVKAMVNVGPPLFCRRPRKGSTANAPLVIDPSSTMLLVEKTGWPPTKSPPLVLLLVLLAIMVLAMLTVPLL